MDKREIKAEIARLEAKLSDLKPEARAAAEAVIVALNGMLDAGPTPQHVKVLRDYLDKLAAALGGER